MSGARGTHHAQDTCGDEAAERHLR
jgi:hypothetical protein